MGGLFGGQNKTQDPGTVQAPQVPDYLKPYAEGAASTAQGLYGSGQLSPAYYPGQTVAPQSAATQQGFNATTAIANNGMPSDLQNAAVGQQMGVINGNNLNVNSNPYLQDAMAAANRGTTEQFTNSILPGIGSSFAKAGRSSSDAYGNTVGQAAGQLSRTLADSNSGLAYKNYNDALLAQQQAAQNAPQLAAGNFTNANALSQAGVAQDAYNQDLTDANVQKYNYNANLPQNSLQNYISLLNSTAGASGGIGTQGASYSDQTKTSQTVGALLSAAAMFGKTSDRRLKNNIKKIGFTKGLNVYSYNYVWGQPDVGFMADEVEKLYPHAVFTAKDGFKRVIYGAF